MRSGSVTLSQPFARLALVLLLALSSNAYAAKTNDVPDPSTNPAMAALIKAGAKFFYLGREEGLDGWLALKDGQAQTLYKPPSNAFVVTGYLFAPNGDNLTAAQIKKIEATNKEVAALMAPKTEAPEASTPDASQPATTGERFMKDVDESAGVVLGANPHAPLIEAIILPDCDGCRIFWKGFRDPVAKGAVRVRLIPVGPKDTALESAAAVLLRAPDPGAAWDSYLGGNRSALAGDPDESSLHRIRANTMIGEAWQLPTVPYLLYRDKDGHVKVVQGAPANPQAVLDDLPPAKTEDAKP